jgi:hypothetical protein
MYRSLMLMAVIMSGGACRAPGKQVEHYGLRISAAAAKAVGKSVGSPRHRLMMRFI